MSNVDVNPVVVLAAFVIALIVAILIIPAVDRMRRGGTKKQEKKDAKQATAKTATVNQDAPVITQKAERRPIAEQHDNPIKKEPIINSRSGDWKSPEEIANINLKDDKVPVKDRLVRTLDKDSAEFESAEKEKYLEEAKEQAPSPTKSVATPIKPKVPADKVEDFFVQPERTESPIKVMSNEEINDILGDVNDAKEDEQIKRKITKSQLDEMNALDTKPTDKPDTQQELSDDEIASLLEMVSSLNAEQFRKLPKDLQDLVMHIVDDIESSEVHINVEYANSEVPRVIESGNSFKLYEYKTFIDGKEASYDNFGYLSVPAGATVLFELGVQLDIPHGTLATLKCAGINPRLDTSYTETLGWTDKKMLTVTCKASGDAIIKKGALVAEVSF